MRRVVLLALTACTAANCAMRGRLHLVPQCADGLPVQILTDPRCPPDGICGYSCLPDRWRTGACPTPSEEDSW